MSDRPEWGAAAAGAKLTYFSDRNVGTHACNTCMAFHAHEPIPFAHPITLPSNLYLCAFVRVYSRLRGKGGRIQ